MSHGDGCLARIIAGFAHRAARLPEVNTYYRLDLISSTELNCPLIASETLEMHRKYKHIFNEYRTDSPLEPMI